MKKLLFIGGGAALLLLCILFGAFFFGPLAAWAQSVTGTTPTTSTAGTNPYCEQYLQDLAKRLNVSEDTLKQARVGAREDVLAQMVKDGKLTQAQADKIKQRLESQPACSVKDHPKGKQSTNSIPQLLQKYRFTLISQIAQGLHLSPDQLVTDLKKGQTLSEIAKAQNISDSDLHTIVLNALQNTINQAQKAGDITAQQASKLMQTLQNHPEMLDKWLHNSIGDE